ncbi:hypothetical protein [Niabella soli]|uniref:Uncharacterized protein n=1 Tax=Niabella soli DSM 19437 TaxID=929713 RepID=W0F5I5_9BACT|nr:hypothetical protein [Niabella soli]AHF17083.1 hypothetical protein NIASO_01420 [Niabella soli DSM 19437]
MFSEIDILKCPFGEVFKNLMRKFGLRVDNRPDGQKNNPKIDLVVHVIYLLQGALNNQGKSGKEQQEHYYYYGCDSKKGAWAVSIQQQLNEL